jgi:hypothetical protein
VLKNSDKISLPAVLKFNKEEDVEDEKNEQRPNSSSNNCDFK